ncbi:MAG: host attachment protein [Alphaproteobacteria bacterium]
MHGKKRLIVLANHRQARLVSALGVKVKETLQCVWNSAEAHPHALSQSHVGHEKGRADSHFFPPHTESKEVEKEQFAHHLCKEIEKIYRSFDEVVLACEPRMMGLIKKELSHFKLLTIYKTVSLDDVEISNEDLEHKVFDLSE